MTSGADSLLALARAIRGRRCLVVGDAMLDVFEKGRADRLAPDAPAPVVTDVERTSSPGGAANVAANLAALGARTTLLSAVGDDEPGLELLEKLAEAGVETGELVREAGRATVVKRRLAADGATLARVDSGDTGPLGGGGLADRARDLAASSEVVVVSDYAGGTVTQELADALGETGHGCVVLDSKSPLRLSWRGLAAATPNHLEAQGALEPLVLVGSRRMDPAEICRSLRPRLGARVVAVTLAEQGVIVADAGGVEYVAGHPVDRPDVNGAGDTFLAAFALALGTGAGAVEAARLGVEAATLAVLKPGTAPVASEELLRRLSKSPERSEEPGLEELLERARGQEGKVVFASGSFDPLRRGHLRLLREARGLGDLLVVGLLPDEGTPGQDALPLEERAEVLGALRFVDHVVVLDGESPGDVVRRLDPDLCVVREDGANGLEDRIVPADDGGDEAAESPAGARL